MLELPLYHVSSQFSVEFLLNSGPVRGRFQKVSGLECTLESEEVREGGSNNEYYRLPTRVKSGTLTMSGGVIPDNGLKEWLKKALQSGMFSPIAVTISALDKEDKPVCSWCVVHAYPLKWSISEFDAKENKLLVETLELAYSHVWTSD